MTPRTEDEIITLGDYVKTLFAQDHFNTLCEEFERRSVEDILQTKPHEVKAREAIYASIQGKRELLHLMLEYANARDKIIEAIEQQEAAPDADEEPTP